VDLASVISTTYLQRVTMQRRVRTSERLLSARSNIEAHCRSGRRFSDVGFFQNIVTTGPGLTYYRPEEWCRPESDLGRFPAAFIGNKI